MFAGLYVDPESFLRNESMLYAVLSLILLNTSMLAPLRSVISKSNIDLTGLHFLPGPGD